MSGMGTSRSNPSTTATRRAFLQKVSLATAGFLVSSPLPRLWSGSPNEKLNIGIVGVSGRGGANLKGVAHENIVALCDIDDQKLSQAASQFPGAKKYNDFRLLLDQKDIDAVVISTPDHMHAPATVASLKAGKHVYCEKPLTHSVYEADVVRTLAMESKLATQMGTQIHALDNYRRVVELISTGAIGNVHEAHVWVGKSWSGGDLPKERPPVPAHIHWDLWLGPAPAHHRYHPTLLPANWRRWWDFGGGTLADMGCHYLDLPFWALNLQHPTRVSPLAGSPVHADGAGDKLVIRYKFPARGTLPPVTLTWYDGGQRPPHFAQGLLPEWGDGVLFVGQRGMLIAGYSKYQLLPESDFSEFEPPAPFIPTSVGHHQEWIDAAKTGAPTTCNFGYAATLTQTALLGNVAHRVGREFAWNGQDQQAPNCPEAGRYLRREYRRGWTL